MENGAIIAETERLILRRYKKEDLQDLEPISSEETAASGRETGSGVDAVKK